MVCSFVCLAGWLAVPMGMGMGALLRIEGWMDDHEFRLLINTWLIDG